MSRGGIGVDRVPPIRNRVATRRATVTPSDPTCRRGERGGDAARPRPGVTSRSASPTRTKSPKSPSTRSKSAKKKPAQKKPAKPARKTGATAAKTEKKTRGKTSPKTTAKAVSGRSSATDKAADKKPTSKGSAAKKTPPSQPTQSFCPSPGANCSA